MMMNNPRAEYPSRIIVRNEFGKEQTLAAGPEYFLESGEGKYCLFLGLGPDPRVLHEVVDRDSTVYYLECPSFVSQMPGEWPA